MVLPTPDMSLAEALRWAFLRDEQRGRWTFSTRNNAFIAETPRGVLPIEVHAAQSVKELEQKLGVARPLF